MDPLAFIVAYLSELAPDEAMEIRAIRESPHDSQQCIGRDAGQLVAHLAYYSHRRYNVYYGVQPRRAADRHGRRENLTRATKVWTELDADHFPDGKDGALAAIQAFVIPPSLLVDSGNGYHVTWDLDPAVPPEDFDALEGAVKRLTAFMGADMKSTDVARIFRVPGTRNFKDKYPEPPLVRIVARSAIATSLAELLDLFPAPPAEALPDHSAHVPPDADLALVTEALERVPPDKPFLDYAQWNAILMALHSAYPGDDGLALAIRWANGRTGEVEAKWRGYGRKAGYGLGTLFYHAKRAGWEHGSPGTIFTDLPAADPKGGAGDRDTPPRPPRRRLLDIITARAFMSMSFPAKRWLVEDLLPAASLSLLAAKPKQGKSQLALNLGWAVATGAPFLGRATQQGEVLYLSYEQSQEGLHPLYHQLVPTYRPADEDLDRYSLHGGYRSVPETMQELGELWDEGRRWDLIILDPLSKALDITDGNSYQEVYRKMDPILEFALERRTHILAIHHSHKAVSEGGDAVMGSTAFTGAVEAVMLLRRDLETGHLLFSTLNRWAEAVPEQVIEFDGATRRVSLRGNRDQATIEDAEKKVLALLAFATGPLTTKEIADLCAPFPEATIGRAVRNLAATYRIAATGKPQAWHAVQYHAPAPVAAPQQAAMVAP